MSRRKTYSKQTEDFSLTVEAIGAGGDGIGQREGKPVFIPKTAPGDVVRVRAEERVEGFFGQVLTIESPSPSRVVAPCPHFDFCGGCALQHLGEAEYRAWKTGKVRSVLERSGVVLARWDDPIFLNAATRRRTTMAVLRTGNGLVLGYNAPRSHRITPVEACLILEPALDHMLQAMKPYLEKLAPLRTAVDLSAQIIEGAVDVVLGGPWRTDGAFTLEQNEVLSAMLNDLGLARVSLQEKRGDMPEILLTSRPVVKHFGELAVTLPPGAFLQASSAGEAALCDFVLEHTRDADLVADLFCGCGTFTGPLLTRGASVYAADSEAEAIGAPQHKLLRSERRNLFKDPMTLEELDAFDAVVIDPPRAGAKEQFRVLAESNVPIIVSLSCNPSTFARDAKTLLQGGYNFTRARMVDQFVWSSHIELAGVFEKKPA
ncbi:MAG: class I SAM-dependent RNA methyltransferase [Alphaproteobacteria bacterium]|nr:class I SAM-dependent RNA methyltransferase [Alphaproteobacteria bacterium]MCB9975903.1 class I SAM-dependent RNA methyltransferase [Rhodospirillales bacterium]